MSQIDYIHFLPSLIWTLIVFLGVYIFILTVFVPEVYKTHRVRRNYLIKLAEILKVNLYLGISLNNYDSKIKESLFLIKFKIFLKANYAKAYLLLRCT